MQFTAAGAVNSAVTHSGNQPGYIGTVNFGSQLRLSGGEEWRCFYEDLASHMRFSHRRSVPRPLFRTLHGLLGAHRPASTCLSVYYFSVDLTGWPIRLPVLLFPASPPFFVKFR
jgi:hypothetical protein